MGKDNGALASSKQRLLLVLARLAAASACVLAIAIIVRAEDPSETYQQILAKRPAPKVDTLSERAAPDQQRPAGEESFLDLLKLREEPNREAVPQLIEILAAHASSNTIHGFAAAQALYAADTHDARAALEKHLLRPEYPAELAVMYTSHWEMREPQRSKFIAAYLLRDLSKDVSVSVYPKWYSDVETKLLVRVKLQNASRRLLAIAADQEYPALTLHFRSRSGMFIEKQKLVVYNPQYPRWLLLSPGASSSFVVALELKEDPKSIGRILRPVPQTEKIKALLTSGDVGFAVREYAEYKLSAMLVQAPLSDKQLDFLRDREKIEPANVWTGRAVSEPVDVTLDPAEGQRD